MNLLLQAWTTLILTKNLSQLKVKHKAKGSIIRTKIKLAEEGEKNSSYFLHLESQSYLKKVIYSTAVNDSKAI